MCLATHEWQAMIFYKGYDGGMGGLHSRRHGGGSFLARCGQDTSAEAGQSDIVCRFYPDKYVFG